MLKSVDLSACMLDLKRLNCCLDYGMIRDLYQLKYTLKIMQIFWKNLQNITYIKLESKQVKIRLKSQTESL